MYRTRLRNKHLLDLRRMILVVNTATGIDGMLVVKTPAPRIPLNDLQTHVR